MSGLMTNNLDLLFKALSTNAAISKDLITDARKEYNSLRKAAQNGEILHSKKTRNLSSLAVCPNCNKTIESQQELINEVRQLQTELSLKSKMCSDLQEQLNRRRGQGHSANVVLADLNDPNRALKVGDMYSELYDKHWTDAYQYLDNTANLREDRILEILQRILRGAYVFCGDVARAQLTNLGGEIACPLSTWTENKRMQIVENGDMVTGKMAELTNNYRKSSSTECVPNLQKSFAESILPTFFDGNEYRNEYVVRYAERCVEVSWYMTLQDPQMCLVAKIIRKSDFDPNLFRPYTKSGDKFDFLVWPALLLHENGPVVMKGVAQPLDSALSPLSLRSRKTITEPIESNPPARRPESNNPGLRGTPWGQPNNNNNDPNAPSPSIDLPKTPLSMRSPRGSARGTPNAEPVVTYPKSSTNSEHEVLTAAWKDDEGKKQWVP